MDCLLVFNSTPCVANHKYADGKAHAKNQDTDATKKRVAMNQKCCVILMSTFQANRQLTMIIIQTITARWPSGQAWKIHERLTTKEIQACRQIRKAATRDMIILFLEVPLISNIFTNFRRKIISQTLIRNYHIH